MNGRTNKSPPVFYRTLFPLGLLPKRLMLGLRGLILGLTGLILGLIGLILSLAGLILGFIEAYRLEEGGTDGHTDIRNDSPLCSTGHRLLGPLPKKHCNMGMIRENALSTTCQSFFFVCR